MSNFPGVVPIFARAALPAFFLLILSTGLACAQAQTVLVTGVGDDTKKVALVDLDSTLKPQPGADHKREVDVELAKKMLNRIPEKGDVLIAAPATGEIKSLSAYTVDLTFGGQLFAILGSAALVIIVAALFSGGKFWQFLIGKDGRYSNSQTQFALWFGAAMTAYLSIVFARLCVGGIGYIGGVSITANVLALSGLSAISFGGAKIVTVAKTGGANPADPVAGAALPGAPALQNKTRGQPDLLRDLVTNDFGGPDLGDFQMIFITLTAVVIYLVATFNALASLPLQAHATLPDIDTSLLGAFGVGQGAYLVKKAAVPPGQG